MNLEFIHYEPKYRVCFTKEELTALFHAATHHYDSACRQLAAPGGVLFGLWNCVLFDQPITAELSRRQVDMFCKVLELTTSSETIEGSLLMLLVRLLKEYPGLSTEPGLTIAAVPNPDPLVGGR